MQVVRNIYGNVKDPIRFLRTNWIKEKHFYSSYSFISKDEPIGSRQTYLDYDYNKIFFAGEHTFEKMMGTMHGAYISGKIAASSILY